MKSVFQTPTPSLDASISFYKNLGFTELSKEKSTLFSDDKVLIEINPDRFARAGLKMFNPSWEETVAKLQKLTTVQKTDEGYLLSDPSGVWVYLIESDKVKSFDLHPLKPSILGNNAGLSLESTDINLSFKIWQLLGFTNEQGSLEQGWIALRNEENTTVSLMKPNTCPHLFFNPSLTFFNGESNLAVIQKVRELNIPITEEITHFNKEGVVDNIIIKDPGGFGFFLFND